MLTYDAGLIWFHVDLARLDGALKKRMTIQWVGL